MVTDTVNVSISTQSNTAFVLHISPSTTSFGETTFATETMGMFDMRKPPLNITWMDGQTMWVCISRCRSASKLATVQQGYQTEADDATGWNEQEYKLTLKNAVHPDTDPEEASKQVSEHCKPVCQQFQGWDLPVMAPWEPSPHGVVESRALSWDYFSFKRGDGAGGHWPLEPFPDEGVHKIHRGGISATSVTGEGTIDYYQCDGQKDGVDRFWNC